MSIDLINPLVIGQDNHEESEANQTYKCSGSRSECYDRSSYDVHEYPFKPPLTTIAGTL